MIKYLCSIILMSQSIESSVHLSVYHHKLINLKHPYIMLNDNFHTFLFYKSVGIVKECSINENLKSIQDQLSQTQEGLFEIIIVSNSSDKWKKIKKPTLKDLEATQIDKSMLLIALFTPLDPHISYFW